jgi:glycosyltransferase involved in cell wall biosynthesis
MNQISALVCTYHGDEASKLESAFQSLLTQTWPPDEIVVVEDGELTPRLNETIREVQRNAAIPIRRVAHSENRGHGAARRTAVESANYGLVAIQDADDLSVQTRFERSVEVLNETGADLVGGFIAGFVNDPDDPHSIREVPCEPSEIAEMAKIRSPVNHTTILARRESILGVGSYRTVEQFEDYELWGRMLVNGYKIVNIPEVMAHVRVDSNMYRRRGGLNHVKEEVRLQRHFLKIGFVSRRRAVYNTVVRSVPKLLPNVIRKWMYRILFRKDSDTK